MSHEICSGFRQKAKAQNTSGLREFGLSTRAFLQIHLTSVEGTKNWGNVSVGCLSVRLIVNIVWLVAWFVCLFSQETPETPKNEVAEYSQRLFFSIIFPQGP